MQRNDQVTPVTSDILFANISDRATNPLNKDTDWSSIHAFCDQLNNDLEG